MKNNFESLKNTFYGKMKCSARLMSALPVFALFFCFNANAQTAAAPSSSMSGPISANVNDTNIVITSQISTSLDPVVSYSLINNTSGAYIVSQGSFTYNNSIGAGTQSVKLNAGSAAGGFTLQLNVTTPAGSASSSMSVSVIKP